MNTSMKILYMCLILLVAATLFTGCASGATLARAQAASPDILLAADSLWSAVDRATGPAVRTPAGGPGRSRPAR